MIETKHFPHKTLSQKDWLERCAAHFYEASKLTSGPRKRRDCGKSHPIEDFLFDYYPYPIALIEQWHPPLGVAIGVEDSDEIPERFTGKNYSATHHIRFLDPEKLNEKARTRLVWIKDLLVATESRPPNFACHGLHEWAMVYRAENIRHAAIAPLRLGQEATDQLVESRSINCTHHDAFRFFAKEARPLNRVQPTIDTRFLNEQPGCVHANMDLYKWAAKSMPWIGSDLLLETFRLATKLRELDMRASPYDLSAWDVLPVKIETPEGRREYEKEQKQLAEKASVLRKELIARLEQITSFTSEANAP